MPHDQLSAAKQSVTTPVTVKKSSKPVSTPYPTKKPKEESSSEDSSSEEEKPAKPVKGQKFNLDSICIASKYNAF
jgi:hypothetical protein